MKYLDRSFNSPANSKQYRDNWDRIFQKPLATGEVIQADEQFYAIKFHFVDNDGEPLNDSEYEISLSKSAFDEELSEGALVDFYHGGDGEPLEPRVVNNGR